MKLQVPQRHGNQTPLANSSSKGERIRQEAFYFNFRLILNKFLSIPELTESRKAKIPINSIDITERFLFSILDTSFIQQIVERACESILVLIGSDGLPPVISSNVFWFKSEEFQHKYHILSLKMKWIYSLWQLMHLLHTHAYIHTYIYIYM